MHILGPGHYVKIKHQPDLGVQHVSGIKIVEPSIKLPCGKVVNKYIMVGNLGGYWEENLEVMNVSKQK